MFENKTVAVVIPCYNEQELIGKVIETLPDYVDRIYVIDDRSRDDTAEVVQNYVDREPGRISLTVHEENQGLQ